MINWDLQTLDIALKVFLIAYTITRFTPIQLLLEMLPDNLFFNVFKLLFSCSKCLALWSGLLLTGDIWLSMAVSFFFVIFEKTFGVWENQIRLKI